MKLPLSFIASALLAVINAMAVSPQFGGNDPDGSASVREANESEVKRLRGKAAVKGRIIFPSPDGRYGFNQPSEQEAEKAGDSPIPNCLIDLKTLKSVVEVQELGDVEMAEGPGMRVRWRDDSKAALFTAPGPCMGSSYVLVVIGKDGKAATHDIGGQVWDAAKAHLENEWPALRQHLNLADDAMWDGELLTMAFDFSSDGAEIDRNGSLVAIGGTLLTNPTNTEGQAQVAIGITGKASVATGKFIPTSAAVSEAGMLAFDRREEPVLLNRLSLRRAREEAAKQGILFGMEDSSGMMGVHELEETEASPLAKKRADVPGALVFASPDGRYAFSRPTIEDAEKAGYEVTNHLIDLKTMKQVAEVAMGSGGDFEQRNHGGMRVRWRPDSRAAIFFAEAKWAPAGFTALVIGDDGKPKQIQIDSLLYDELVSQLKSRWSVIREKLKRADLDDYDGENGPWSTEYLRYGAEFTPDGKSVRVKGIMETNGKRMEGQMVAEIRTEGLIDLASGKFSPVDSRVIQAGIVTYDDDSNEILKPKVTFPAPKKKP